MKERKMLYAGSFDPVTYGHLDIIRRGARLCDTLVVGVLRNYSKAALFSVEERMGLLREATADVGNVVVDSFEGLLANYVKQNGICVVIRGLRATWDFDYEIQMAQMNARLYGNEVETVFLMTDPQHSFVSSSIVKEVFSLNGEIDGLVPPRVIAAMEAKRAAQQREQVRE
ncbi:MAG: pantetheine-phosphate adenylyltransferase [Clostridiales Family XIII bacterium]|jgi:pantetheine-phosphate adenylyltransferase|nr:pantetheine-phosphate adenylyltransferase [Clostridiales Family XIII bacterium]